VSIPRAHIFRNGIEVDITPERVLVLPNHNSIARSTAFNCVGGLCLGDHPPVGGFMSMGVDRREYLLDAQSEAKLCRLAKKA
jgi:hypothetical protein